MVRYMERDTLKSLEKWKNSPNRKPLIIQGARQVGKSTIIRHVFPEYNIANFDDRLTRLQAREEPKLFFLNNPRPLFIDEVQKENSILEEIKLIVDANISEGTPQSIVRTIPENCKTLKVEDFGFED